MNYILPVTLDLYKTNPTINAKQNDAGSRYILATITANGVAQSVPETATVSLKVEKADGTRTLTAGTVQEGKVLVGLTNQTLAVPGTAICELQIIGSEQPSVLKTIRFFLNIDAEVYSDDVPESTDEFTALTETMADYATLKTKLDTIEEDAEVNIIETISIDNVNVAPTDRNINLVLATAENDGMMSSEYAGKLDSIAENAEVNILEGIQIDGVDVGITSKKSNIPLATSTNDGAMSSEYAGKLDGIAENANNYTHPNHTGDVTSDGDGATTIANDAVTNAKLSNMPTMTIKGNNTGATADPIDLSVEDTKTMLDITDVTTKRLDAIDPFSIYGFHWDKTTNAFTRTLSSLGRTVNLGVDDELVLNEFDRTELFNWQKVVDDYGNHFTRIPTLYFKKTITETEETIEVSRRYFAGAYLPWCFWDFTNGVVLPYVDIGCHIGSLSDDGTRLESKPNKYPLINKNIVQMRTLAQANGAGYQQLDIHTVDFLQTLFTIEQATIDSQSKVMGYVNGNYKATHLAVATESDANRVVLINAHANLYEVGQSISIGTTQGGNQIFYGRTITEITVVDASNKALVFDGDPVTITTGNMVYNTGYKTGFSANIASSVGSIKSNSSGKHPFIWHGIESLYGDVWQFVDGVNINENQSWVCKNAANYASNAFAYPYEKLSYINATSNNYVLTRGFDVAHPYAQLPTAVGAVGDSQYKDYYYQATGQRIARVGGSWSSGSFAGLFYWNMGNSSSDTSVNFGGRLIRKAV